MEQMSAYFLVADPKPPLDAGWPNLSDENDAPIWASTKWIQANYLVSSNVRHFPPKDNDRHVYEGIEYITPERFLRVVGFEIEDV